MHFYLRDTRLVLSDHRVREFFWYSVPGICVAIMLRAWLMIAMPWGYYHPDTHDFLTTIYFLKAHHHWTIHGKTTFLTPALYVLAFLVPKVPALILIPLGQHLRGLLTVLMIGGICRLWCALWQCVIVPLTVLAATQPAMIFWEHTLLSESGYVFGAVAFTLAGTVFTRWPGWQSFGGLLGGMFLVAAARPEGNLWLGGGVLLTLAVYWRTWRDEWIKIGVSILLSLVMLFVTRVSHSGLLLYSSLVQLTPDDPHTLPGFGPYIRPLRDQMSVSRQEKVSDDVVRTSRRVNGVLLAYARDHPTTDLGLDTSQTERRRKMNPQSPIPEGDAELDLRVGNNVSNLCRRLAIESAVAHPFLLPGIAWRKFLAPINQDSGGQFGEHNLHAKQAYSLAGKPDVIRVISPALIGTQINTYEQASKFVLEHYELTNVRWFNKLEETWQEGVTYFHFPSSHYSDAYRLPGLPVYQTLAILGAVWALWRPGPLRRFQWVFVPTLFGTWFVVMLTAAVIPRHRFVWEPFWLIYLSFLLDGVGSTVIHWKREWLTRRPSPLGAPADQPL